MSDNANRDDVLFAFAVESRHDQETLKRYLRSYPQFADALVDLSHELRFSAVAGDDQTAQDDPVAAAAAWREFSAASAVGHEHRADVFVDFKGEAFARVAAALDVSRGFLVAIRDRNVDPTTVPARFLKRLADAMDVTVEQVFAHVRQPPAVSFASFRADEKPTVRPQMSFEALVRASSMTEAQKSTLLSQVADDGRD